MLDPRARLAMLGGAMNEPSNPNYYGCKVAKNYRTATVWVFRKSSQKLVGTIKRTCAPKLPIGERRRELGEFLTPFGITL